MAETPTNKDCLDSGVTNLETVEPPTKIARFDSGVTNLETGECMVVDNSTDNEKQNLPLCGEDETNPTEVSGDEDSKKPNLVHISGPPVDDVEKIFVKYWEVSRRKQKIEKTDLGPCQYHEWGRLNNISERSFTLKKLLLDGFDNVINCRESVGDILKELTLDYSIAKFKTLNEKEKKAVAYDIKTEPRLSFIGIGVTEDLAIEEAAKKALQFFIKLCD